MRKKEMIHPTMDNLQNQSNIQISRSSTYEKAVEALHLMKSRLMKAPDPTGLSTYDPLPTDIIISTFPKAGTTLMQYMAYLTVTTFSDSPACDKYTDIIEVVPWLDYTPEMGLPSPTTEPRLFKSHAQSHEFKHTNFIQKHVVIIRDPLSYPASWMDFLFDEVTDYEVKDSAVRQEAMEIWAQIRLLEKSVPGFENPHKNEEEDNWFSHAKSWLENKRSNVLVLFYEDVVKDMEGTVVKFARFAGLGDNVQLEKVKKIAEMCSREKMADDSRFYCHLEGKFFGFNGKNVSKAKREDLDGFKRFAFSEQFHYEVRQKFQKTFSVDTYEGVKEKYRNY